ncbi:Uncharacterized protein SCF082_LOCUS21112 [Durusdinium trenchii]|uniref:Uncharacterized protein n=1 Tax=Durusdinium trenchii TaxID=1381693 RepID=A0ABP0L753_9DINO
MFVDTGLDEKAVRRNYRRCIDEVFVENRVWVRDILPYTDEDCYEEGVLVDWVRRAANAKNDGDPDWERYRRRSVFDSIPTEAIGQEDVLYSEQFVEEGGQSPWDLLMSVFVFLSAGAAREFPGPHPAGEPLNRVLSQDNPGLVVDPNHDVTGWNCVLTSKDLPWIGESNPAIWFEKSGAIERLCYEDKEKQRVFCARPVTILSNEGSRFAVFEVIFSTDSAHFAFSVFLALVAFLASAGLMAIDPFIGLFMGTFVVLVMMGKEEAAGDLLRGRRIRTVHFGSSVYFDHKSDAKMRAYLARHRAREDPLSAGALSRWVLWSEKSSLAAGKRRFAARFRLAFLVVTVTRWADLTSLRAVQSPGVDALNKPLNSDSDGWACVLVAEELPWEQETDPGVFVSGQKLCYIDSTSSTMKCNPVDFMAASYRARTAVFWLRSARKPPNGLLFLLFSIVLLVIWCVGENQLT